MCIDYRERDSTAHFSEKNLHARTLDHNLIAGLVIISFIQELKWTKEKKKNIKRVNWVLCLQNFSMHCTITIFQQLSLRKNCLLSYLFVIERDSHDHEFDWNRYIKRIKYMNCNSCFIFADSKNNLYFANASFRALNIHLRIDFAQTKKKTYEIAY